MVENVARGKLSLLACKSGRGFAERVAEELGRILNKKGRAKPFHIVESDETVFANGEIKTVINENIRGNDIYIIQCIDDPLCAERSVNDNFMALATAIHAAYQSDAECINAVIPQFPYSRQERRTGRECITAKQICLFLEVSGADRVITLDIHAEAIQGFFNRCKLENLHASRVIIEYFKKKYLTKSTTVVAPDMGGVRMARFYSKEFKRDLAIVDKARDYMRASTINTMRLVGDVKNKDIFICDDLVATGGTLLNAAKLLKENGARDIFFACSLPFFNDKAVDRFQKEYDAGLFKTIIGTDAVFRGERFVRETPWYEEVSIAPLFAHVITNINRKRSVSALLL